MILPAAIVKIAPAADRYAAELTRQMAESGIMANPKRASMFLGQIHVESNGFRAVVESLNYSVEGLKATFGRHRISVQEAELFGRAAGRPANQNAIANIVYGGEWGRSNLGNTEPGDGWRFRGRGLKQLTGRDNYRRFSRAWQGDESILANPDRVADPDGAVASAIWFWLANGLSEEADRGTVASVTKIVNGGANGLAERIQWTSAYRRVWRPRPDFSNVISRVHSTEDPA